MRSGKNGVKANRLFVRSEFTKDHTNADSNIFQSTS